MLREVAKLDKFESDMVASQDAAYWDVQQVSAAMAAALVSCTRGEVRATQLQWLRPDQW